MIWQSKKQLRGRIEDLERYNRFLREEVERQHYRNMDAREELRRAREERDNALSDLGKKQKRLLLDVSMSRVEDMDSDFNTGWNLAIAHVERLMTEHLGVEPAGQGSG